MIHYLLYGPKGTFERLDYEIFSTTVICDKQQKLFPR